MWITSERGEGVWITSERGRAWITSESGEGRGSQVRGGRGMDHLLL